MSDPADGSPARTVQRPSASAAARAKRLLASRWVFVAWVVAATLVAVPLLYSATAWLGPGTVRAQVEPSLQGRTELSLPPLGTITARTHRAPVQLGLELREVDVLDAIERAGRPDAVSANDPLPVIEAAVRSDLGAAAVRLVLSLAAVAAACGVVAALAYPGPRSLLRLLAGAGIGLGTVTVLVAPAALGYDPDAFVRQPTFTGQLGSAEEVLTRVGSLETSFGSVESRTRLLSERIAGLYSASINDDIARSDGEVVLLHVSDLHLNTVGLSLARDLADSFSVDAVVDTGDITSFGFEPEAAFTDLLGDFEVPYYVVAGNHDSESVRARLQQSDDVIYLDEQVADIAGLKVLGMADPTVTALRRVPQDQLDRTYRAQFPVTRRLVRTEQPDLLLVHNPVQIRPVIGMVPVAAAGHLHRDSIDVVDGTVITVVGSSGATGLGNLIVDEDASYQFQLLRFVDNRLVAIDRIELRGAGGDFVLDRRLISPDEPETDDAVLDEQVDEAPLEEIDDDDLERIAPAGPTTTGPTTTGPTTTGPTTTEDGP